MSNTRSCRTLAVATPIAIMLAAGTSAMAQTQAFDTCADALAAPSTANMVSGTTFTVQTTAGNGVSAVANICSGGTASSPSKWFKYVAPANGTLRVSLCTADGGNAVSFPTSGAFNTVMTAHTSCAVNGSNQISAISCNDDGCGAGSVSSKLTLTTTAGQTYLIRVAGVNAQTGIFTVATSFTATPPPPPPPPPASAGPDVTVYRVTDVGYYGVGTNPGTATIPATTGMKGLAVGTTSYNAGDVPVDWRDGGVTNTSPVIAQNLYKLKDGKFIQLGQSWLKHGFLSTNSPPDTGSGSCVQPPLGGDQLGVNCSDTYGSSLNGSMNYLGPRSAVNATTGYFAPVANGSFPSTSDPTFKRLQVRSADLEANPLGQADPIRYFAEGYYVTYDDHLWNNAQNNMSYVEVRFNNTTSAPAIIGTGNPSTSTTWRRTPAIAAWGRIDPSVVTVNADHIYNLQAIGAQGDNNSRLPSVPRDLTCRYIVAAKASETATGSGIWRYVYAIANYTSDRSAQAFSVKLPAGAITSNEGMYFPPSHSGEPYSNADWVMSKSNGVMTFSTQDYATNPNANAIRWGTMYTFWFDCNVPPAEGFGSVKLFKPAFNGADPYGPAGRVARDTASAVLALGIPVPRLCIADVATVGGAVGPDGTLSADDVITYIGRWLTGDQSVADVAKVGGVAGADGQVTADDLIKFLDAFFNPDTQACGS